MIEDVDLRELYNIHSFQHLEKINALLLQIEAGRQEGLYRQLLKEVHAFKGDSRMLGVVVAEQYLHEIETIIIQGDSSGLLYSEEIFSLIFNGLDRVRELVIEAVTGAVPTSDIDGTLALLSSVAGEIKEASQQESSESDAVIETTSASGQQAMLELLAAHGIEMEPVVATVSEDETTSEERLSAEGSDIRLTEERLERLVRAATGLSIGQKELQARLKSLLDLVPSLAMSQRGEWGSGVQPLAMISEQLQQIANKLEYLSNGLMREVEELQYIRFDVILKQMPRMVRDLAIQEGKNVCLEIVGGQCLVERRVGEALRLPLVQLIRNAIDHGIEYPSERLQAGKPAEGTVKIIIETSGAGLHIRISDDGRGLNREQIIERAIEKGLISATELGTLNQTRIDEFIFVPGFSTKANASHLSGRGIGMDIVKSVVEQLNGKIRIESDTGRGCTFDIQLRAMKLTRLAITAQASGHCYDFLIERLEQVIRIEWSMIFRDGNKERILWNDQLVELCFLVNEPTFPCPCLIYRIGERFYGIVVTKVLGYREISLSPESESRRGRFYLDTDIWDDGRVAYILDIDRIVVAGSYPFGNRLGQSLLEASPATKPRQRVLLLEDSVPIGTQLQRILQRHGYEVEWATNGAQGYEVYRHGRYDCVISDVEMPGCSGLEFVEIIRSIGSQTPVIILTTLAEEADRQRALSVGANAYLTKGNFVEAELVKQMEVLMR